MNKRKYKDTINSQALKELAAKIRSRCSEDGLWHISPEEIIATLDIPYAQYYQTLYAVRDIIPPSALSEGFSSEESGVLVTVLEALLDRNVEDQLFREGVFLPHTQQIDALEMLINGINTLIAYHHKDLDVFLALYLDDENFNRALQKYIRMFFPFQTIIQKTAENFVEEKRIHPFGSRTVLHYYEMLLQRHKISIHTLFAALETYFFDCLSDLGYFFFSERTKTGGTNNRRSAGASDNFSVYDNKPEKIRKACAILDVSPAAITYPVLKRHYKRKITEYHPDRNPAGLETSKKINSAYSILLAYLKQEN